MVDEVFQGRATDYAVILDRISQDVPFYRAYLKNAAISGTAVMNNPFWWSADEKFFNNALASKKLAFLFPRHTCYLQKKCLRILPAIHSEI